MSYHFAVNALSEIFRNGEYIMGTVNVSEVAKECLKPEDYERWVARDGSPEWSVLDRHINRSIDYTFVKDAYEHLSLPEYDLYCKTVELQKVNDARFRIWSEMHEDSFDHFQRSIWLATEFVDFVDNNEFWRELHEVARQIGFMVHTLDERRHLDKKWVEGVNGFDGSNHSDENAIYGENHGRLERQVELRYDVKGMRYEELLRFIDRVSDHTEALWKSNGVGVV